MWWVTVRDGCAEKGNFMDGKYRRRGPGPYLRTRTGYTGRSDQDKEGTWGTRVRGDSTRKERSFDEGRTPDTCTEYRSDLAFRGVRVWEGCLWSWTLESHFRVTIPSPGVGGGRDERSVSASGITALLGCRSPPRGSPGTRLCPDSRVGTRPGSIKTGTSPITDAIKLQR